ncbi:adenosylmethionine-8-amino-7-oxononanoate aminotransferase [Corynebacterium frankenforstense DSM 45800]|uniref:Adenosylmethionine-8-amino-7-oxononanoate aminotransferase n=1 Tax=Corynebacterium frankenforstense DSM 45800 TaxID=1437875 RepID=A0A1L7CSN6_9CORY|nr:adenosylmethionine--8-amino-7-oxononanoate transaminase [Corynebacterium frankenforstense]APT88860.1 adenosylmethionine-8-amino-7-oxononanoate aminotransferase [Corynebacterium frankenforstense DSM 45800]
MSTEAWDAARIEAVDRRHVWHPYAPRARAESNVPVRSARGTRLTLADGREVIDGMSLWWSACHGHCHEHLREAAHRQIDTMSHVMFGGLTHQPAAELAERLVHFAGGGLDAVFYSDSGSVSVEVALKMALQCQRGRGLPRRDRFLTWRGGYHGDTQGPMSVTDPDGGMHSLWAGTLTPQVFVPAPPPRGSDGDTRAAYLAGVEREIRERNATEHGIAGIIVEPVVQGAGGMRFHDHELVRGLGEVCRRTGTLLILDEIATGFGRTGETLVCTAAGVHPDILCLGKALTGGFMSFAATMTTAEVAAAVDTPAGGGALMHGPTFMGNPLACAVSLAALDLTESGYWRERVPRIAALLTEGLAPLADDPNIADVRVLGAIGVVEGVTEWPAQATRTLLEHGVWLRPFGRLLYTMPPFVSTDEDVETITAAMRAVVGNQEVKA